MNIYGETTTTWFSYDGENDTTMYSVASDIPQPSDVPCNEIYKYLLTYSYAHTILVRPTYQSHRKFIALTLLSLDAYRGLKLLSIRPSF